MFLSHACALLFLSGLIPLQEQAETDQVSAKFLSRIDQAMEEKQWEPLFLLYEEALTRHRYRVAPDPKIKGIQVGMVEYLVRRYAPLPKEAFEVYRNMRDAHAEQSLETAIQEEDAVALDRALSLYFFASMSDTYLDRFARYLQERGRYSDALLYWDRLLRFYPDSDIPKEVVLARMAVSCQLAGDAAQLSKLKKFSLKELGARYIWAGREKRKLSAFLDSIEISPFPGKITSSLPLPMATRFPQQGEPRYVRNDLLWWNYDFAADEEKKTGAPNTNRFRPAGRPVSSIPDYPLRPAYCRWKGKPYVIFTNGYKVVAVNPERVREGSRVYWTFPEKGSLKVPSPSRSFGIQYHRPYIGVTIAGEYAYATLYSSTRVAPNNRDFFSGPTRLACFHIPTGKRMWNTEGLYDVTQKMERREQQAYDFLDQNFAFSGPPLIRDGHLFIGICTSPAGEQASRVLCLDSRTGAPKWCAFLASFTQPGNRFGRSNMSVSPFLPMMVEKGGVLFVQTSLGVVGAIRSTTGSILWLSRYNRNIRVSNFNSQGSVNIRPANEPILSQGKVWILPQDANELLAFDQQSGAPVSLPLAVAKTGIVPWPEIKWLLGVIDDWMVLGGVSSYVLRLSDFRAHSLASANTSGCGRGQIVGEDVYLSIQSGGKGALGLYAGLGSWRKIRTPDWRGDKQRGNLLLAGSTLVVSTDQIYFYTDATTVRRRFASRIKQSPPHLKSLLHYASLMDSGGIWKEAVEAYLEYDRITGRKGVLSTNVRDRLYEIFLKMGEDLDGSSLTSKLRYFQQAREFTPSARKKAHMEWKISELLCEMDRNREAIDLCREMRDRYPDYIFPVRGGETAVRVREFTSHLISRIQEKDPGAYRHVEILAKQALEAVRGDRVQGWRKVETHFPHSQAAREARSLLLAEFLSQEKWTEALGLLRKTSSPSDPRRIFQLLEKIGDRERLVSALQNWRLEFGDTVLVAKGNTRPVHEIAGQWLQKIAENSRPRKNLPDGSLTPVGQTMEKVGILPLSPLQPQGLVPPMFPKAGVLLQLGSSVELRDIYDGSRKWRVDHPFGYSGIHIQAKKGSFHVRSIDRDSPAAKAGVLSGDLLQELNGIQTRSILVDRFLRAGLPGSVVSMKVKRKETLLDISFTLGTMPPDKGAPVLGGAYTQGYSLAIVWPGVVVAVDVRSGVRRWVFATEGGRFSIQGVKGGEGTLLLGGKEEGRSRLVCLEDRTGEVRWIRDYSPVQSGPQKVFLFSSYQDEAVSLLQFSRSGKSDLRIFDRETGVPLSETLLFSQGILSQSVDEAAGVLHVLQGLSGRNRQLRGISLRGKSVGKDLYLTTLSPNEIGSDLRGSQIYAKDSHLVLMVPSGVQRRKSGVYVFDLRKKRLSYTIPLPEDREWSKGSCEGVPIDSDGILYLYSETRATEPGNRTGFLGAYILGETPQLKWEAVAPTLPFSASARWTLDTGMKNHLLFLTPEGDIPGEKGDRPVAALYSKVRGGYLEQVFSDLDDRLKGKVVSRAPGRLLFSTSTGVKGYGSP